MSNRPCLIPAMVAECDERDRAWISELEIEYTLSYKNVDPQEAIVQA